MLFDEKVYLNDTTDHHRLRWTFKNQSEECRLAWQRDFNIWRVWRCKSETAERGSSHKTHVFAKTNKSNQVIVYNLRNERFWVNSNSWHFHCVANELFELIVNRLLSVKRLSKYLFSSSMSSLSVFIVVWANIAGNWLGDRGCRVSSFGEEKVLSHYISRISFVVHTKHWTLWKKLAKKLKLFTDKFGRENQCLQLVFAKNSANNKIAKKM